MSATERQTTECRSCGKPMFFATGISGRPIPIDAAPVPDGNIVIRGGVALVGQTPQPGESRYVSHVATCPHSRAWRMGGAEAMR